MTVARIGKMTIEYLADHPDALPIIARWQHAEWGHLRPNDSVEKRMERLRGSSDLDRLPLTVVALEDNEVLGSASLVAHDMETRMELTPWLAGVFVGDGYRRGAGPTHHCRSEKIEGAAALSLYRPKRAIL